MRPRSEDRGEHPDLRSFRHDCDVLQCGHGPKTVENVQLVRSRKILRQRLQCGHGPKTVENNPGQGAVMKKAELASMRPRSEDRGELLHTRQSISEATSLQCGHGPKTVE